MAASRWATGAIWPSSTTTLPGTAAATTVSHLLTAGSMFGVVHCQIGVPVETVRRCTTVPWLLCVAHWYDATSSAPSAVTPSSYRTGPALGHTGGRDRRHSSTPVRA